MEEEKNKYSKKIKILKIIFTVFVILVSLIEFVCFAYYIKIFICGFTPTDILGNVIGEKLYGFKAIQKDSWANLFFIPYISFSSFIQILYCYIIMRKTKKKKIIWLFYSFVLVILNILMWIFIF